MQDKTSRRPKIQKIQGTTGKGANIAKWTILLLLWGSLISAALGSGNPENPKGLGNGFRKRSEHCEMDDFAAPPHFGPSAAGKSLPEKERTLRNEQFCCFCGVCCFSWVAPSDRRVPWICQPAPPGAAKKVSDAFLWKGGCPLRPARGGGGGPGMCQQKPSRGRHASCLASPRLRVRVFSPLAKLGRLSSPQRRL